MEKLVISDFKLGIIAGGQLGKMLVQAASSWDVKTYILDKDEHCPASSICTKFIQGDPLKFDDVYRFGKMVDMVTFEIENLNIEALKKLKSEGKSINPDPDILEIIKDKLLQKDFYKRNNIPTAVYKSFENKKLIIEEINSGSLKFPFVQKLRIGGYDGRGVAVIKSATDLNNILDGPSIVEDLIEIQKEISIIAAKNKSGEIKCFPTVEMEFNDKANLVELLICPALIKPEINQRAIELATKTISALDVNGLLAVEMFVDKNNYVWINEIAPRPHNSGHHTIESVITSQFEQLLRAIFNFPLGSTKLKLPAVMINLLGDPEEQGNVRYEGLTECMAINGVKIHLYGKKHTKPFRKMGHVTILDQTIEEAKIKADEVKHKLKVKAWKNL